MLEAPMLPAITSLLALQDLETRAEDARRRLADAPVRIDALDVKLADATQALDTAKAALVVSRAAKQELEKEASVAQQRVSKYKEQLMQAKDNKQFHALQHEITTFSAEVERIEGIELERMLEIDERAAVVKAAEATLAADKKSVAAEKAAITADTAAVKDALAALLADRAELVFFSEQLDDIARAKAFCRECPVMNDCLEAALVRREPWGVWGGELLANGKILAQKRNRGRPPKVRPPELLSPVISVREVLAARQSA